MKKRIISFVVLILAVAAPDLSAQNFFKELGEKAEKAVKKAVNEQMRKPQAKPKSQPAPQQTPKAAPSIVLLPAEHAAFFEPIGYPCNEGRTDGTGKLPPTSESGQKTWINAQPAVGDMTNKGVVEEYNALKAWYDKANFTVLDATATRMYNLEDDIRARANAVNRFVGMLKSTSEYELVKLAKHLEGNDYKRTLNSSLEPLKPYFDQTTLEYLESYGNLGNLHLAERTVWYPYAEREVVTSSVEGLVGEINLDGKADLGGMVFDVYPTWNHKKNIAILRKTHAAALAGKDIVIPDYIIRGGVSYAVIMIDPGVFYSCAMKSVILPKTLQEIGNNAFANMTNVKTITVPEGVTELGAACFHDSYELTEVHLPNSAVRIGGGTFANCGKLTKVTLPKSVKHFDTGQFENCTSLESVVLPEDLKQIRSRMFMGCVNLKSVTIPATVESIASGAFDGCTKLKSITLPSRFNTPDALSAFEGSAAYVWGKGPVMSAFNFVE